MQLDRKRKEEMRRRKGTTTRTILQFVWFVIAFGMAGGFVWWTFDTGLISAEDFYRAGIPRDVPKEVFMGVMVCVTAVFLQMLFVMGFLIASPAGRARGGQATAHSFNVKDDNLDDDDF